MSAMKMSSQVIDQSVNQVSSQQSELFRKNKRAFTKVAQLAQKEFIKNQLDEDEDNEIEEDLYENEQFLKRTFSDLGGKLYQSYTSLLLADEKKMKEYDVNKIMRNYLNNGLQYEQDYLDEKEFHMGDLVIEFPNPDYTKDFNYVEKGKKKSKKSKENKDNENDDKETTIDQSRIDTDNEEQKQSSQKEEKLTKVKRVNLLQAKDDFKKAFSTVDASIRSDVSENKIFSITYENAFKKLSHYLDSKAQMKQEELDSNMNDSMLDEGEIEQGREYENQNLMNDKSQQTTDTLTLLKNLLFNKKQQTQKILTKNITKKQNNNLHNQDQMDDEIEKINQQYLNTSSEPIDVQTMTKIPQAQLTQQQKKNQKSESIRKIMKGGKFFQLSEDKKSFERTQNQTRDYLTLIRHATWIRLVKYGFKLRHFLSSNGKSIFTVCYATDENLKITAEKEKLSKALNLEFSDLLSFEPVDSTLRPLRMNTRLSQIGQIEDDEEGESEDQINNNEQKEKITGYLRHIRYDINRLLSIIDYKKIARETNISTLEREILIEKSVEIKEDSNLTNQQWELYFQYLNQVSEKVTEIRKQFKFSKGDKRADKINEIIEFQKFKHPLQYIIHRLMNKDENIRTDYRTLNSEDSMTALKTNPAAEETYDRRDNLFDTLQGEDIFKSVIDELKKMNIDFKEFREVKLIKKKDISQKEAEKEIIRQRVSDMKTMKKIYKKYPIIQSIMKIRSKRIRHLMVDLLNDPSQLKKRYEQMEKEVKEHEEKYSPLRDIFSLRQNKLLHVKLIKLYQRQLMAHKYREVFTKALDVVNYPNNYHKDLKNLWDFMNMEPFETHYNYFRTPKNISFKKKQKLNQIWKCYEVTQNGRVSQFSNMERLKLVNLSVQKAVNLFYLQEKMYIKQYFFLNDRYDLYGNTYKYIFEGCPLQEKQNKRQAIINSLRNFFIQTDYVIMPKIDNNNNNEQIDPNQLLEIENQGLTIQQSRMDQLDSANSRSLALQSPKPGQTKTKGKTTNISTIGTQDKVERLFVQKKIKNLQFEWSFKKGVPWYIPHVFIRDYYGEKVALYFSFLGYYTKSLLFIGILGLGVFIIQQVLKQIIQQ